MPTLHDNGPLREYKKIYFHQKKIYIHKYLYRFSKDIQIAWSPAIDPLGIKDVPGVWWSEKRR